MRDKLALELESMLFLPILRTQYGVQLIEPIGVLGGQTYRSQKRQEELFKQGTSKLQKVGVHHYGLACDILKSIKGYPSWKGDFSLLGELGHEHGLIWGGDRGTLAQNIPSLILFMCNASP